VFKLSFDESDFELEKSFFLLSVTVNFSSFNLNSFVLERKELNILLNEEFNSVEEECYDPSLRLVPS